MSGYKQLRIVYGSFLGMLLALQAITAPAAEVTIDTGVRHILKSDADKRSGEIGITESDFSVALDDKVSGQLPVTVSLMLKHIDIDENIDAGLPAGLEGKSLSFGTKFPVPFVERDDYFIGVDIMPSQYTDDWKWADSAFRMPFRTYLIYRPGDEFILVGGVTVRIDYENEILPFVGLIYKPNDRLSINLASSKPNITYKLSESLSLLGEFDLTLDEYEVTRNGRKGVNLQYRSASAGAGVICRFNETVSTALTAGGVFARKFEYEDDGEEIYPEPSVYIQGKLSLLF